VNLPELSVDGFHFSVTVFSVIAVTTRPVGVVGGVLSAFAADVVGPVKRNTESEATSAVVMIKRERV
jgi:hypothetical protein